MRNKRWLIFLGIGIGMAAWGWLVHRFPDYRLFTVLVPPVVVINFARDQQVRTTFITVFVVFWLVLFFYESSMGLFYLRPAPRDVPVSTKFLFPPAGWIMFYSVDDNYGGVEVYGRKGGAVQFIDPHEIFRVRTIGFDNYHRNILSEVSYKQLSAPFCRYLRYRFPTYDDFYVFLIYYPELTTDRTKAVKQLLYQCGETLK